MDYVTIAKLKARVATTLNDESLQDIIAEQSAAITAALGKEPGCPVVETFHGAGPVLFLTFSPSAASVQDLTLTNEPLVDPTTYIVAGTTLIKNPSSRTWLSNLNAGYPQPRWPRTARVTYAMADSPGILAVCQGVCIDLCRLAINEMGVEQSESMGGYSHTSKDTSLERRKVLGRLGKVKGLKPAVAR